MRSPESRLAVSSIDGQRRSLGAEDRLNQTAAMVFSQGGGLEFLLYLRAITINRVCEPTVSNEELRHLEGARWLFGVIQARVSMGKRGPMSHPLPETDEGAS